MEPALRLASVNKATSGYCAEFGTSLDLEVLRDAICSRRLPPGNSSVAETRTPPGLNGAGRTDSLIVVGQEDLRGFQGDNAADARAPPGTLHGKHAATHIQTILKSE
jgi:hypothetical protein